MTKKVGIKAFPENVSACLFALLFTLDNVWSYIAVTHYKLHEINIWLAPSVEKDPRLYFLCVPLQMIMIYLIAWMIYKVANIVLQKQIAKERLWRVTLTALVIYWTLANSSINFAAIFLHHFSALTWTATTVIGILAATGYAWYAIRDSKE